ncbi:MAG TPA: redoxin domain-containing protein, partial [Steroidobacteraceae bacterium]
MRANASELWLILAVAAVAMIAGLAMLRTPARAGGWVALAAGLGTAALLALAQFTGRMGPEHLWFRSPTFYAALFMLMSGAAWWLRRPAPRALRFGLPALLAGIVMVAAVLARSDGRSTPLAMLMPTLGTPAPELSYFDDLGAKRELADLRGRVVLLNFWATWCAPCRREMPMLSKLQREYADKGLVVLYVSLED